MGRRLVTVLSQQLDKVGETEVATIYTLEWKHFKDCFILFLIMCMCVECRCLKRPEKVRSFGAGITGGGELPRLGAGIQLRSSDCPLLFDGVASIREQSPWESSFGEGRLTNQ